MKKQIKINLGSGIHLIKDFINVDIGFDLKELEDGIKTKSGLYANAIIDKGAKFVKASMTKLPFEDNYADYIEALDCIEHVGYREVSEAFQEIYRVLKPGGELVLMTIDFDELARLWVNNIAKKTYNVDKYINLMEVIYGNQVGGIEECHKTPFNADFLTHMLLYAGFKKEDIEIRIYPTGSSQHPSLQTQKFTGTHFIRTSLLYVKAKK